MLVELHSTLKTITLVVNVTQLKTKNNQTTRVLAINKDQPQYKHTVKHTTKEEDSKHVSDTDGDTSDNIQQSSTDDKNNIKKEKYGQYFKQLEQMITGDPKKVDTMLHESSHLIKPKKERYTTSTPSSKNCEFFENLSYIGIQQPNSRQENY